MNAWRQLHSKRATEIPKDFDLPDVGAAWNDLVHDADRKRGFKAFEACTMMSLRRSLRSGSVWINHSLSFRERDEMLISPEEWARERDKYVAMLGLPASADAFLEPLLANLHAGVAAVAEACDRGSIEIGADGMLHLPAIAALVDDGEPRRTGDLIFRTIGDA